MWTCPNCPDYELEMYEHDDEYEGDILRQEQHFECPHCHRTFARNVWYKIDGIVWIDEE